MKKQLLIVIIAITTLFFMSHDTLASSLTSPFYKRIKKDHQLQILNSGLAAFEKRLDMIERAKKSIEIEYFIYTPDRITKIFTHALIKKAKEGVKIRLLIDTTPAIFKFNDYFATPLINAGIQVRYYNRVSVLHAIDIQYRNHRKMFIIDGKEALTGGRNMANEYFDSDPEYNFLDRDIWIKGELVKTIKESFYKFWDSKYSKSAKIMKRPIAKDYGLSKTDIAFNDVFNDDEIAQQFEYDLDTYESNIKDVESFMILTEEDRNLEQQIRIKGREILQDEPKGTCSDITFASDKPIFGKRGRTLKIELERLVNESKESISFDSPYFILDRTTGAKILQLLNKGININVLTNSLSSTDAFYIASVFNAHVSHWSQRGIQFTLMRGNALQDQSFVTKNIKKARWGTHSKTAVIDKKTFIVGTYNLDPRSKTFSSELIIACRDNEYLSSKILENIEKRSTGPQSIELDDNGRPKDGNNLTFGASISKKALYYLLAIPSNLFQFLL